MKFDRVTLKQTQTVVVCILASIGWVFAFTGLYFEGSECATSLMVVAIVAFVVTGVAGFIFDTVIERRRDDRDE